MSHFSKVKTEISDLEILETAVKSMGLTMEHGTMCRYYYGTEPMEHVIKLPGKYDCGVVQNGENSYSLTYDRYQGDVEKTIGKAGELVMQCYAVEKLKAEAKKMGYKLYGSNGHYKVCKPSNLNQYLDVEVSSSGKINFKAVGFKGEGCMIFKDLESALGVVEEHSVTSEYLSGNTKNAGINIQIKP